MIDERLWRQLEIPQPGSGRSVRRLLPESPHDIHLSVTHPGQRRMLLLRADARAADRVRRLLVDLPQTSGLSLSLSSVSPREFELQVSLTADDLREVFTPLVEDIAEVVRRTDTAESALEAAVRRFLHWQQLMRTVSRDGLGSDGRRGLFGELYFLREYLLPSIPHDAALSAWTGPEGTPQDFQLLHAAVEVKTTTAKSPRTVRIANERQLDDTGVEALLLAQIAVDERRGGSGESLNALVDSVRNRLESPHARARLDAQLVRVGYFPHQRDLYEEPRFTLRRTDVWRVVEGFPRIVESDLDQGVGNCTYDIDVSALEQHRVTTDEVTELIRGTDG
ncbi:PD-(D/E)XK motif protein [Streptomyces albidoflavus]|uniref:PD-(D/E)XK motif protein n=1 Tax=Streptomyces TaxID=1883 RepID=UPI001BEB1BFB|nr:MULTISPECIES: PD-(D/E)XK motif protein [unclassified Streptomyces]MBT2877733.1 PD-(D/E)XK motif protein [Streptomyces sp. McG6]MBT2883766.1 PD-(D/E)XK motif protein [Streptomyces sp. McG5]MBT2890072.1 PD-(D/E)XK motif protein [Streptomyces sp. McG2]WSB14024.1 PD-(D/E)XK motif protein [Streptomyces albidoflavus]